MLQKLKNNTTITVIECKFKLNKIIVFMSYLSCMIDNLNNYISISWIDNIIYTFMRAQYMSNICMLIS